MRVKRNFDTKFILRIATRSLSTILASIKRTRPTSWVWTNTLTCCTRSSFVRSTASTAQETTARSTLSTRHSQRLKSRLHSLELPTSKFLKQSIGEMAELLQRSRIKDIAVSSDDSDAKVRFTDFISFLRIMLELLSYWCLGGTALQKDRKAHFIVRTKPCWLLCLVWKQRL